MDKIEISVIITNYNYSNYLNRSIRSAFVQNYPVEKYEILVIDDASSDNSKEIIESFGNLITKMYLKTNVGLAKARNIGVNICNGKYILFLDADDFIHRDLIYIESLFLDQNHEFDAVAVDYYTVDNTGIEIDKISCEESPLACGVMYRKEKFIETGCFDNDFRMHEDKDFRIRFTNKDFFTHRIQLPLYRYRKHNSSLTLNNRLDNKYRNKLEKKHGLNMNE
jgi:glycosyltransferase involved in cell wall biosynthesis